MTAAATSTPEFRCDPRMQPVRFSLLKLIAKSPAHYLHALNEVREETRAMRVGSGSHAMVLGGDFKVYDGERRGKAWAQFRDEHPGALILTPSEFADAQGMANAVRNHPLSADLLAGSHEHEARWSYLGRDCLGHLDVLGDGRVVDLKTTNDANPERFARQAIRMGYHAQLAWYLDGVKAREAYVVAVESSPPHPVTCLKLTPRALEQGRKLCRLWMERLLACEAANAWPGYCESVVDFDVPDDDFELQFADEGGESSPLPF